VLVAVPPQVEDSALPFIELHESPVSLFTVIKISSMETGEKLLPPERVGVYLRQQLSSFVSISLFLSAEVGDLFYSSI